MAMTPPRATRRSRLALAMGDISRFLASHPTRVFTERELAATLDEHRATWRLPASLSAPKFIDALHERGELTQLSLSAEDRPHLDLKRYAWGPPSPFAIALSIRSGSYLSHASAIFLHALTDEIPRTIYVNKEQSPKPKPNASSLTQQSLDRAFANKPRESTLIYRYDEFRIAVLSGKATSNLEVSAANVEGRLLPRTKLERTLIDITVRPIYGGGPFEVLAAYRAAKGRVSLNVLLKTLRELDYVYPYHQAIGFYLERAGFDEGQLAKLEALKMKFDFYVANRINEREYSRRWRVYYPKGM